MDQISRFGAVAGYWESESGLLSISELKEKPDRDYAEEHLRVLGLDDDVFYTLFGLYILPPKVFSVLSEQEAAGEYDHGELQLTAALEQLRKLEGAHGTPIEDTKIDIGVPHEYVRAMGLSEGSQ